MPGTLAGHRGPVGGGCLGSTVSNGPSYRLVAPAPPVSHHRGLDDDQQRVVDHPGGPLLVLAGPGTGKTTTLVEAIVDRIERRGADPSSVLALTFSRKAAEQLRDRVTARLGRTMSTPISSTFHSFAYGLVRAYAPADLYAAPLRLLSAPEQDVLLQELLTATGVRPWPEPLRAASAPAGSPREVQSVLARAREKGLDPVDLARARPARATRRVRRRPASFMQQYLVVLDDQSAIDYADLIRRAVQLAEQHRDELRARYAPRLRRRVPGHRPQPGRAAARARRRRTRPGRRRRPRPVDLRLPRRRRPRHPRLPARRSPRADGEPGRRWSRCGTTRRFGPRLLRRPGRSPPRSASPASIAARRAARRSATPTPAPAELGDGRVDVAHVRHRPAPRPSTSPTCCVAPTSRTACPGPRWRCWSGRGAPRSRRCAGRSPPRACRSRWPATTPRWSASRP